MPLFERDPCTIEPGDSDREPKAGRCYNRHSIMSSNELFPNTVTTASGDRILQQFPGVPTSVVLQLTLLHQKSISFFAKFLVGVLFIGIRLVENRL